MLLLVSSIGGSYASDFSIYFAAENPTTTHQATFRIIGPSGGSCGVSSTQQISPSYTYTEIALGTINDQTLNVLSYNVPLSGLGIYLGNDWGAGSSVGTWVGSVIITTTAVSSLYFGSSSPPTTIFQSPTTLPNSPTTKPTITIQSPTTSPNSPTTKPTIIMQSPTTLPNSPTSKPTTTIQSPTTLPNSPTTKPTITIQSPTTLPNSPTTKPTIIMQSPTTLPNSPTTKPTTVFQAPTTMPFIGATYTANLASLGAISGCTYYQIPFSETGSILQSVTFLGVHQGKL